VLARPVIDLGIEVSDFTPKLSLPHDPEVIQRLPLLPARFIAVHPGSGGTNKSVPLPGLFKILGSLARLFPELKLLILAGEADKTLLIGLIKNMPAELKPMVQLIDNIDLLVLAEILSRAEIFVGMDSGPGHLAAAVGTRTVVIFGPSDPKTWAPPQPWARAVSGNCACAPCSDHERRNCNLAKCLAAIDDQAVAKTAHALLFPSGEKNAKIMA
jgi:ADP-heptose:LPS heptosyltransferase